MKNIFIGGVAKSGKSTLSKIICKDKNYNHIPIDYFTSSLKHNFPDLKITSNVVIDEVSSKKLSLLLSRVIDIINNTDELFIIDSAHILPEDIDKYLDRDKWDVYFLGYPNTTPKEKFNEIRKYETCNDWTRKRSDDELINTLDSLINLSKKIENDCNKLNIEFIDTSHELKNKINSIYLEKSGEKAKI